MRERDKCERGTEKETETVRERDPERERSIEERNM